MSLDIQDEKILEFFNKIDAWIIDSGFISHEIDIDKIKNILNRDTDDLKNLEPNTIMADCISLYKYIDSLQSKLNHEKSILEFAESSIMYIAAPLIEKIGDKYTKWEYKYNIALRSDPLCKKLNSLALNSKTKITQTQHKIDNVKKITDLMVEISKGKKYEYRNS